MNAAAETLQNSSSKSVIARYAPTGARVLLGVGFFASGIFGLLMAFGIMKMPPPPEPMPENFTAFMTGIMKSGYMMALIKATETVCGALLLSNRFVPLALTILAPVLVNILMFHAFLQPGGIVPGAVLTLLEVYLAYAYRDSFRSVVAARAKASP
jgi:uncharacterized membrane protein YphA (DoxX/SURF4 family)